MRFLQPQAAAQDQGQQGAGEVAAQKQGQQAAGEVFARDQGQLTTVNVAAAEQATVQAMALQQRQQGEGQLEVEAERVDRRGSEDERAALAMEQEGCGEESWGQGSGGLSCDEFEEAGLREGHVGGKQGAAEQHKGEQHQQQRARKQQGAAIPQDLLPLQQLPPSQQPLSLSLADWVVGTPSPDRHTAPDLHPHLNPDPTPDPWPELDPGSHLGLSPGSLREGTIPCPSQLTADGSVYHQQEQQQQQLQEQQGEQQAQQAQQERQQHHLQQLPVAAGMTMEDVDQDVWEQLPAEIQKVWGGRGARGGRSGGGFRVCMAACRPHRRLKSLRSAREEGQSAE